MKYIYYPGCSLKSTGRPYEESLLAVFKELQIPMEELHDWNCCGATSYMSVDELKAFGLAARNLALAESQNGINGNGDPDVHIVAPCSACYLVLIKTERYLKEYKNERKAVIKGLKTIGLDYNGKAVIRHPVDVLFNDIGLESIAKHIKKPLKGIKVASYYGCQMIRPFELFDPVHYPVTLDLLVDKLGATPLDWPLKTRCCGGSLTGTLHEAGMRLNYRLLSEAKNRGADMIITTCPLCQFNLECYQDRISSYTGKKIEMPILYFTQLVGLALGIPEKKLGIHRSFIRFPNFQALEMEV